MASTEELMIAPGSCFSCEFNRPGIWIECQPGKKPVRHYGLCRNEFGEKGLCMVWKPKAGVF